MIISYLGVYEYPNLMLKRSLMQILARLIKPPPPIPCIALPASSILVPLLSADIREPTRKTILATNNIGFRPQMSLILPQVGVEAAAASK